MTTDMTIETQVKALIIKQLGCDEAAVKKEAKFIEDLGADSLDIVELVMAIEDEFKIDIPDDEAENIRTVDDAIKFVEKVGTTH